MHHHTNKINMNGHIEKMRPKQAEQKLNLMDKFKYFKDKNDC